MALRLVFEAPLLTMPAGALVLSVVELVEAGVEPSVTPYRHYQIFSCKF
jgi:hypothetical protein